MSVHAAAEGDGCVAIGNIIRSEEVPAAIVAAFAARPDDHLAERLLCGLEAGAAAGGELKQVKSAALLVVDEQPFPLVDLRVDYDPIVLPQLRFLWESYQPFVQTYVERAVAPDALPGSG